MPKAPTKDLAIPPGSDTTDNEFVRGNNYLFLIGINAYEEKRLNNCVTDAQKIKEILLKKYTFEEKYTFELWDKAASRKGIWDEFLKLTKLLTEHDNLVIYYSGHGMVHPDLDFFCWIPIEAASGNDSLLFQQSDVITFINKMKCRHLFLMVDCCFSGTMWQDKSTDLDISSKLESYPSRWGLSSGRAELVSDGDAGKHSPFAQAIIDLLADNSEPLFVSDLGNEAVKKVIENKEAAQTPRFERLNANGHAGGQMIFYPRKYKGKNTTKTEKIDILAHLPVHPHIGYPANPFKGLKWFEEKDARIFFGRSNEIRDIFQIIGQQNDRKKRLILLYGHSGTGKSSLLEAGLLPRLPQDWMARYKRRGRDGSVLEIIDNYLKEIEQNALVKNLLIIDQLEEIFSNPGIWSKDEESLLSKKINDKLSKFTSLTIVLSFREEYLGRIISILNSPPESYTSISLHHISKQGVMEASTGISSIDIRDNYKGLKYESDDLPSIIANDFSALKEKQYTPLLQYLLRKMWDTVNVPNAIEPLEFTYELYDKVRRSSMRSLLETQLHEVETSFKGSLTSGLLVDILFTFVTEDLTVRGKTLDDIEKRYSHIGKEYIESICKSLENNYLLSSYYDIDGNKCYRLCHDSLAQNVVQIYQNSEYLGQRASRFLEQALRAKVPLSKEGVLVIADGIGGRKCFSADEYDLYKKGWKKHVKVIVLDEIRTDNALNGAERLAIYENIFGGHEGLLFQSEYNRLRRELMHGILSYENEADQQVFEELRDNLLKKVRLLGVEEKKTALIDLIHAILFIKEEDNIKDGLIESINNFSNTEESALIEPLITISSKIIENIANFDEGKGVIDFDLYILSYSKSIKGIIEFVILNYCNKEQEQFNLLNDDIIINFFIEAIENCKSKNIASLSDSFDPTDQHFVFIESLLIQPIRYAGSWSWSDRLHSLSLFVKFHACNRLGVLGAHKISSFHALFVKTMEMINSNASKTPTVASNMDSYASNLQILNLLSVNKFDEIPQYIISGGHKDTIPPNFFTEFFELKVKYGLYLMRFDTYRLGLSKKIGILVDSVLTELQINNNPLNISSGYLNNILEKIRDGEMTTALGSIDFILENKIPISIKPFIVSCSIEQEVNEQLNDKILPYEVFTRYCAKVRSQLVWNIDYLKKHQVPVSNTENIKIQDIIYLISEANLSEALLLLKQIIPKDDDEDFSDLEKKYFDLENNRILYSNEEYSSRSAGVSTYIIELAKSINL